VFFLLYPAAPCRRGILSLPQAHFPLPPVDCREGISKPELPGMLQYRLLLYRETIAARFGRNDTWTQLVENQTSHLEPLAQYLSPNWGLEGAMADPGVTQAYPMRGEKERQLCLSVLQNVPV
jgi:hypothetical protein